MLGSCPALSYPEAIRRISVLIASSYRSNGRKDVFSCQQSCAPCLDRAERNESTGTASEIACDGLARVREGGVQAPSRARPREAAP